MNNRINGIFTFFSPLYFELSSSYKVINNFLDYIVFNLYNKQKKDKTCAYQLNNIIIKSNHSIFYQLL